MMGRTLLFNHTHIPHSNHFEEEVRDVEISSHTANYLEISLHVPNEVAGVFRVS